MQAQSMQVEKNKLNLILKELVNLRKENSLLKNELAKYKNMPPIKIDGVFYLSGPSGDSFITQNASQNFEEYVSLYRFEKLQGENRALVYVENRPDVVERFVSAPERQRGVCEEGTSFISDATSIETEAPGEAVLEGDKWRVVKKAKIRYL